ncbi:hypothetical protein [Reticulibacter mediterranei]|uniref:hypothetical protein n=1 Tax=Reticulibacter mediterranei TaxID=2778369 RepID=UPI001C693B34|nr:hypothetical protein [Reticulibacter mediterranei]
MKDFFEKAEVGERVLGAFQAAKDVYNKGLRRYHSQELTEQKAKEKYDATSEGKEVEERYQQGLQQYREEHEDVRPDIAKLEYDRGEGKKASAMYWQGVRKYQYGYNRAQGKLKHMGEANLHYEKTPEGAETRLRLEVARAVQHGMQQWYQETGWLQYKEIEELKNRWENKVLDSDMQKLYDLMQQENNQQKKFLTGEDRQKLDEHGKMVKDLYDNYSAKEEQLKLEANAALELELEKQVTAVLERAMQSENDDDWDSAMQASRDLGEALQMSGVVSRVSRSLQGRALEKFTERAERLYRSSEDADEGEGAG